MNKDPALSNPHPTRHRSRRAWFSQRPRLSPRSRVLTLFLLRAFSAPPRLGGEFLLLALALASPALAQDARPIVAESQRRGRANSQHYEGMLEVTGANGKVATKSWQSFRIGSYGNSKAVIRFTAPAEVKGVALLVVNHPDRSSDQWMWTPAIGRERRIALQDRSTRFFGTDFSFEDLEERDVDQFDYRLDGEEPIDGAPLLAHRIAARAWARSRSTRSLASGSARTTTSRRNMRTT